MDEMKDPITLDFTATQAPAEDAPVGQKALDSERPPVRVVLLALDQGKFDSQRSLDELAALAEANGMKNGTLLWPVRIGMAGKAVTPGGAIEIAVLLGREESLRRLRISRARLNAAL